jgi:WD40 repeat protein
VIIGDVNGKIGVYNTANGSLMKPAIDGEKYMVVTLDYVDNQRCFIAGYMNGVIRIFDENGLEECSSVRIFDMANISPDLCCLRFNPTDNTVVTASDSSQIVKIWDYVGAKWDMDVTVCEESDYILHVAFLQPFSMFATSDSSGNVSIWGSRGGRQCGARLSGFLNQNPPGMEEEKHLHFDVHNESNVCRILPPDSHVDSMQVQYDAMIKNFKENVVDKLRADSSGKPGIDGGRVVSRRGSLISILQRRESVGVRSRTGSRRGSMVGAFSHRNSVGSLDWLETSFAAMHAAGDDSVAQLELDDLYFQAEIQWGKVMAAQTMTFHAENFCLYTADYLGTIRAFSLKYLIYDLFADELRKLGKKTSNISGLKFCHSVARSEKSALPPILKKRPEFAVNKNVDPLGFLGIEFCWAVKNAHDDRIIFTTTTPHGIVTSGESVFIMVL